MNSNNWISLSGGSVNSVYLKKEVVRRELTSVSLAIHQLLKHLAAKKLSGIPRLLGYDENYEYLSYIPGESIARPWCDAVKTDLFMASLGKWLKSYHQAVVDFRLKNDAQFSRGTASPEPEMIVCHSDLGPWNCIQHNGKFQGIIDWDLAHYGYAIDDLAEMACEFIPIRPYKTPLHGLHHRKVPCIVFSG